MGTGLVQGARGSAELVLDLAGQPAVCARIVDKKSRKHARTDWLPKQSLRPGEPREKQLEMLFS